MHEYSSSRLQNKLPLLRKQKQRIIHNRTERNRKQEIRHCGRNLKKLRTDPKRKWMEKIDGRRQLGEVIVVDRVLRPVRDGEQHWADQGQGQENVNASGIHAEDVSYADFDQ